MQQASPRPPVDLFKAIFADESSDSDDAEQVADGAIVTNTITSVTPSTLTAVNTNTVQESSPVPSLSVGVHSGGATRSWQNLSLAANKVPEVPLHTVAMVTSSIRTQSQLSNVLPVVPHPQTLPGVKDTPPGMTATNFGPPEAHVPQLIISSYGPTLPPIGVGSGLGESGIGRG